MDGKPKMGTNPVPKLSHVPIIRTVCEDLQELQKLVTYNTVLKDQPSAMMPRHVYPFLSRINEQKDADPISEPLVKYTQMVEQRACSIQKIALSELVKQ